MKMHKTLTWLLTILLIVFGMGCGLFTAIGERLSGARETAGAIATEVKTGRNVIATARAISTQVGGSGLLQTAQAMATQAGDSGFLATAQAFATQQGPSLVETLQAITTQQTSGMMETLQAMGTYTAPLFGEAPEDIPIAPGEVENLVSTSQVISYSTKMDYNQVLEFYRTGMVNNGWSKVSEETLGEDITIMTFEKDGRSASLTLSRNPLTNQTLVVIAIQSG